MIIFPPPLWMKPRPTLTLVDNMFSASALASYSGGVFDGKSLGAAKDDRRILIALGGRSSAARTVSAITVAGFAASLVPGTNISQAATFAEIWQALVPTGATGNVAITLSAAAENIGVALYRLIDYESIAPFSAAAVAGDNAAANLNFRNSGVALGLCVSLVAGAQNHTWTGLTEEGDIQTDSGQNTNHTFASGSATAPETNRAISCDNPANPSAANMVTVTASFR